MEIKKIKSPVEYHSYFRDNIEWYQVAAKILLIVSLISKKSILQYFSKIIKDYVDRLVFMGAIHYMETAFKVSYN